MTAILARRRLLDIILADAVTVTLVEGDWGVGKTHAWEETISQALEEKSLSRSGYATASLFGLESIEEINRELLTSIVITGEGDSLTPTGQFIKKSLLRTFGRIASLTQSVNIPHVSSLGNLMNAAIPLMLRARIVCIDDLERKGDGLKLISLLGFLDRLREKYKCKVILISNIDMFSNDEKETFRKYLEKTVDYTISFKPSFEEIEEVVFSRSDQVSGWIRDFCRKADLKNIRVIRRIEHALSLLTPIIADFEESARENIIQSFCFCAWCLFDREKAPSVDFIKSRTNRFFDKDQKPTEQETKWEMSMRDIGFASFDELDVEMIRQIELGFIEEGPITPLLKRHNEIFIRRKARSVFDMMWDRFYFSLSEDDNIVVQEMTKIFNTAVEDASPFELDNLVKICRVAKRDDLADDAILNFVAANQQNTAVFKVRENGIGRKLEDERLIEILDIEAAKYPTPQKTLQQALEEIASGSWRQDAEKVVIESTEAELVDLLRTSAGKNLHYAIHGLQKATTIGGATSLPEARQKIKRTFDVIRGVGNLNRLRLEHFLK